MADNHAKKYEQLVDNKLKNAKESLRRYETAGFQSLSEYELIEKAKLRFLIDSLESLKSDFEVIKNE